MMTKNPLALAAGVVFMLFGAGLACFFGYHLFVEERIFKASAQQGEATVVQKERKEVTEVVFGDQSGKKGEKSTRSGCAFYDLVTPVKNNRGNPYTP